MKEKSLEKEKFRLLLLEKSFVNCLFSFVGVLKASRVKTEKFQAKTFSSTDNRETKLPFVPKIERKNEEEIQYFEPRKRLHSRHKKEPKNFLSQTQQPLVVEASTNFN